MAVYICNLLVPFRVLTAVLVFHHKVRDLLSSGEVPGRTTLFGFQFLVLGFHHLVDLLATTTKPDKHGARDQCQQYVG